MPFPGSDLSRPGTEAEMALGVQESSWPFSWCSSHVTMRPGKTARDQGCAPGASYRPESKNFAKAKMRSIVNHTKELARVLRFSLAVMFASGAEAQPPVALAIQKVEVSYLPLRLPDQMTITGVNFGSVRGTVALNAINRKVTLRASAQIVVWVSCASAPGTYLLNVDRTDSKDRVGHDEYGRDFGRRRAARPPGRATVSRTAVAIGAPRSAKNRLTWELRNGQSRLSFNPPGHVEVPCHGEGTHRAG